MVSKCGDSRFPWLNIEKYFYHDSWPLLAFKCLFGEYFDEESKWSSFNVLIISAAEVAADGRNKHGIEKGQIFSENAKKPGN